MPRYGFRCEQCAAERDVWASIAGPTPVTCACGAPMRRLFTPVGLLAGTPAAAPNTSSVDSCHDPSIVGGCLIRPELRAAWSAKNRGDGAGVDRALSTLESAGIAAPFGS